MTDTSPNSQKGGVTTASEPANSVDRPLRPFGRRVVRAIQLLAATAVLAGAWFGTDWMTDHRVHAKRRKTKKHATLVEVTPVTISEYRIGVKAMGRVRAAQEVALQPRVKGEIRSLGKTLVPGGLVPKGQVLLRIDASDYLVAVRQLASAVKLAQADLQVERGRQASVRKELQLVGSFVKGVNRDLVLRGPQLRKVEAAVESARAALRRAQLDLKRTVIRSPMNAVVLSRDVSIGTRVTESSLLTRLVGTDAYWAELVIPVDRLRWIRIPGVNGKQGAQVRLRDSTWSPGKTRTGRVIRLMPDLEEKGRMARLLVRVDDPLALLPANRGQPRLLIGSWIAATIEGSELQAVAVVPRRLIRSESRVWRVDNQGRLDVRKVGIVYWGPEHVVISKGVSKGDRLVVSNISTPVQSMPLRVRQKRPQLAKARRP